MSIYIELVKKWLADNDSVSQEELKDNRVAAYACAAADACACADAYACAAADAYAVEAACAAADADVTVTSADSAAYWVKRYEATKEQK